MRVLSGTVIVLSFAIPAFAQRTVVCTSSGGDSRKVCPADTRNGVVLSRERSDGVCQQGSTWGYNQRGIYVSGGCSAEFIVGGSGNSTQNGDGNSRNQNGDGNNGNQNGYGNNRNGYGDNGNQNGYGNNGQSRNGDNGQNGSSNNGGRRGIPAGTRMDVRLEQTVNPNNANQGETVRGTLVNDLVVNGNTLASAGSAVQMRVSSVQAGQSGQPGSLSLQLASISANGREIRVSSNAVRSGRDRDAGDNNGNGGGNVVGSVLGAINAARNTGELPRGSVYSFRTTGPGGANGNGYPRDQQ